MSTTETNLNNSPANNVTPAPNNGSVNISGNTPNSSGNNSPSCVSNSNTVTEGANAAVSSVSSTSTATTTTTTTGEPLKIIKTQLIPFHALQTHSQMNATSSTASLISTVTTANISTSTTPITTTTIKPLLTTQTNHTQIINLTTTSHLPTIQLKNLSHPFALNPSVAAKITQVKTPEPVNNNAANTATVASSSSASASFSSSSTTMTTPYETAASTSAISTSAIATSMPSNLPNTSTAGQAAASNVSAAGSTSIMGSTISRNASAGSNVTASTAASVVTMSTAAPVAAVAPIISSSMAISSAPSSFSSGGTSSTGTVNVASSTLTTTGTSIATATGTGIISTAVVAPIVSTTPIAASTTIATITNIKPITTIATPLNNVSIANAISTASLPASTAITNITTTVGAIKVTPAGNGPIALGSPIALNTTVTPVTTSAQIRAIGAGGQSTQVRVVMPTSSMIKQLENAAAAGRTQITALPASPVPRTISNTSITVTRPVTQATYLPRATVTATPMTGVANGQRLVTPIRATPASIGSTGTTVTGITATGSFVRGTAVSRNTASPGTTVISPATNATWMTTNSATGQVQLIRNLPQQSRQRIITTQGITTVVGSSINPGSSATINAVSTATSAGTPTVSQVGVTVSTSSANGTNQPSTQQATIQNLSSPTSVTANSSQPQQPTYVATLSTVIPPRQHQAAVVYSSNLAATTQAISQAQPFSPTVATAQRFAVTTQLAPASGTTGATRQLRPFQFSKSFSATKLNTTSISIRAPNLPQLTPTISTGVSGANVSSGSSSPRSSTVSGSSANVIPTSNLSTTRIFQLQQPPNGTTPQLIGSTGRLAGNVMLQPIILNTSTGGKIGLRPPVSMAAKVQPSLTITQLGISKLSSAAGGATVTANPINSQNLSTNIQTIIGSSGTAPSISTAGGVTATTSAGTQLITAQNLVTSSASSTAGATVVPLTLTARGATTGNILAGTITPIKNANGITLGKVMTSSATTIPASISNNNISNSGVESSVATTATISNAGTIAAGNANVFIHQRPSSTGGASVSISVPSSNAVASTSITTTTTTSMPTAVGTPPTTSNATFLPAGSTIYYESVPANTIQVSTGVLSLTTTTISNTTNPQTQNQNNNNNNSSNSSISSNNSNNSSNSSSNSNNNNSINTSSSTTITSLPFVSHPTGTTPTTFTVVPSTSARTIGQLQIPASSSGNQITAVPLRFNNQVPASSVSTNTVNVVDSIAVSQPKTHLVQTQPIIIPASHNNSSNSSQNSTPMVIPLQTSIKVTTGPLSGSSAGGGGGSGTITGSGGTNMSTFIRKREGEGSLRAAKNLGPTLLSMSSNSHSSGCASPVPSSLGYGMSPVAMPLTVESLAKKDRAAALASGNLVSSSTRSSRAGSPASTDGSTTISANSSPGLDQQMQDGNLLSAANDSMHFNPIKELYSNHPSHSIQHNLPSTSGSSRNSSLDHRQQLIPSPTLQRINGGNAITYEYPPRKKSRRSTNDSQISTQSQSSLNLPPPNNLINPLGVQLVDTGGLLGGGGGDLLIAATSLSESMHNPILFSNSSCSSSTMPPIIYNKENAKPTEYILRRPRNCTLLNGYKSTWKATSNHFQRYSDVKSRKPNPSVIDLANQPNILAKINGWKIYHLQSQMKDLCDDENSAYERLADMLKELEGYEPCSDTERISDLIKGNMQRSKIIVDGVTEAQNQIMKIFDHKTHVSDIINRCASKRNFKKREKI